MNDIELEKDVLNYILINKDELKAECKPLNKNVPAHLQNIYRDIHKSKVLTILCIYVIHQFNLNPEQLHAIINEENINNLLGKDFLYGN